MSHAGHPFLLAAPGADGGRGEDRCNFLMGRGFCTGMEVRVVGLGMSVDKREDFRALHAASSVDLFRVALSLCGSRDTAHEMVQEAFARTFAAWGRIRSNPAGYAYRTVINLARRHARRQSIERAFLAVRRSPQDAPGPSPDTVLVESLLHGLSTNQRAVLVLRYFSDMTEAEVADVMGIPTSTVKSHARRGLKAMRDRLARED